MQDHTRIKTKEEARQYGIDWQHEIAPKQMSYAEIISWQGILRHLARKFGLVREFRENGIL